MKVKKAHVRTMLPVASAGFASFWAWFYLVLLSPYPASHAGDLSLALKLAFLVGVLAVLLLVYLKRDLFGRTEHDPLPWAAALLSLPLGLLNLAAHYLAVPPAAFFAAWFLGGCGFSLVFLLWPKVFMVGWQKDVGAYLSASALAGAVIYLFACELRPPYGDVALVLLPLASLAVLHYVRTHIVGSEQEPEAPLEQTRLFPLTGFTVAVFGALFGIALYLLCANLDAVDPLAIAAAIACGAGLHLALSVLVKRYVPFGTAEKVALLLLVVGFLGLAFLGPGLMLACCLFIVGVYVYLDFSNMSALVGFASGHPSPFWRIAARPAGAAGGHDRELGRVHGHRAHRPEPVRLRAVPGARPAARPGAAGCVRAVQGQHVRRQDGEGRDRGGRLLQAALATRRRRPTSCRTARARSCTTWRKGATPSSSPTS